MNRMLMLSLALVIAILSGAALAQSKGAMWVSGNALLANCDETSPTWVGNGFRDPTDRSGLLLTCSLWLTGLRQGVDLLQQFRPAVRPSPAEGKQVEKRVKEMKSGGQKFFALPNADACIPHDVTNDQLRLVVIKWMRDHPTELTEHGALLAYSAIVLTYPCETKK